MSLTIDGRIALVQAAELEKPKTMAKLVAMCGLSFSGKTTLATHIARHIGARYISLDAINDERGLYGGQGIAPAEWERTSAIAIDRASASLRDQCDVVLDDTLCFAWLRARYAAVAQGVGARLVLVYVAPPLAQIYKAMALNDVVGTRRAIQSDVFQEHLRTFEHPRSEEGPIIFDRTEPVEVWLKRHF